MDGPHEEFTLLLKQASSGSEEAADRVVPIIYGELRGMAQALLARERAHITLSPTALVHDAWLKLAGPVDADWQNRRHFFGAAAQAMRRILVDSARRRAVKGEAADVEMDALEAPTGMPWAAVPRLDEALAELERDDPRKSEVVMLRYFSGLSVEDTARAMDLSPRAVKREWRFARAWLYSRMQSA